MYIHLLFTLLLTSTAQAEIGKVLKFSGTGSFVIKVNSPSDPLKTDQLLEEGDQIKTTDGTVVILLYPATQMIISKNTIVKLTKNQTVEYESGKEKTSSIIEFLSGLIRLQVSKDENQEIEQKVQAPHVVFGVRGTEFEISNDGEDIDLDVVEGEVEVSSPDVQTFAPEIVKASEGFKFSRKERKFMRRQFRQKFKDHPGFMQKQELFSQWRDKRKLRREKRNVRGLRNFKHKKRR
ncbi:MAG: FecR domain-containing protein [Bacteriovoracaceae bacterium]